MKHEILHALGFSVSLYAYFRDENGEPLTLRNRNGKPVQTKDSNPWGDNVVKKFTRHDWKIKNGIVSKDVHMIVTPKVKVSER